MDGFTICGVGEEIDMVGDEGLDGREIDSLMEETVDVCVFVIEEIDFRKVSGEILIGE